MRNIIENRPAVSNAKHVDPQTARLAIACVCLRIFCKERLKDYYEVTDYVGLLPTNLLIVE
jgi:hypothetical protein